MGEAAIHSTDALLADFRDTRAQSLAYCEPLTIEDYGLQAEPFTSPPKWHLAHTTWFFETFLLKEFVADYQSQDPLFETLFNSYYNGVGEPFPRPQRGLLSRPSLEEVHGYRAHVDAQMQQLLGNATHPQLSDIRERTRLGIEHEQQHQELFFTDIKYSLAINPLLPTFQPRAVPAPTRAEPLQWYAFDGGLVGIGHEGDDFCFDNELPRHRSYLQPFELANRLVTNEEYQDFVDDGGYERPELWLADGWTTVEEQRWRAPLYWIDRDGEALEYTLHGPQPRDPARPVCHVSGYEAEAFARWYDARLPTEQEWEHAAATAGRATGGVESGCYHPSPATAEAGLTQLYGDCWQWTQSAYGPYPGYRPSDGAIGEYNGKFMSSQWVLRGGSCVSRAEHLRSTYRNFFYPPDRWQFTGIRLARASD